MQTDPHLPEAEAAVLGALLNDGSLIDTIMAMLPVARCFYVQQHMLVYQAMLDLHAAGRAVDTITVCRQLETNGDSELAGGYYGVMRLSNDVTSTAHVEVHTKLVQEKHMTREMMRICQEAMATAKLDREDVFDQVNKLNSAIDGLTRNTHIKEPAHIGAAWQRSIDRMQQLRNSPYRYTGVPSGYEQVDDITSGWQPGDMIVLSAEPSVGKTAFALNLACNAATHRDKPTPVAFFSLEMSETSITQRLQANVCSVPMHSIRNPKLLTDTQWQQLHDGAVQIAAMPLYMDTPANMTMFEFRAKLRQLVHNKRVGLAIVDYLQFLRTTTKPGDNREQEVSKVSRELKETAKELGLPIIVISSLNRNGQIRDSGNIDFDADIKINLKKPTEQEIKDSGVSPHHRMLDITKNRNGETVELPLLFVKELQRFV